MLKLLEKVERRADTTKLGRLWMQPLKYIYAIGFRELLYKISHKQKIVSTTLFFGRKMTIALPAATDIYLTGGKSHPSEIRLARFLIKNLHAGDSFMDIGAHYGDFTLLAAELVGHSGMVRSFEPASDSFNILSRNVAGRNNITVFPVAVSDGVANVVFYEFENMQSEYNSMEIGQFENEGWFKRKAPRKVSIAATGIDRVTGEMGFMPDIIKVDVEGAEDKVVLGGQSFLQSHAPVIILEYLAVTRHNEAHQKAVALLRSWGYVPHVINKVGEITPVSDIENNLKINGLNSDNIVFLKTVPGRTE